MGQTTHGTSELTTPKPIDQMWQVGYIDINGKHVIKKEVYTDKKDAIKKAIEESRIFFTFNYHVIRVERKITTNIIKQ